MTPIQCKKSHSDLMVESASSENKNIHVSIFLVVNVRTRVCSYMDATLLSCCVELHSGIVSGIHCTSESAITSLFGHYEFSLEIQSKVRQVSKNSIYDYTNHPVSGADLNWPITINIRSSPSHFQLMRVHLTG